jgi:SAM-dependent methyltransferase
VSRRKEVDGAAKLDESVQCISGTKRNNAIDCLFSRCIHIGTPSRQFSTVIGSIPRSALSVHCQDNMATTRTNSADIKEVVKRSYDRIAPAYLEWSLSRPSPRLKYLDHILRTLPPNSKVLELGCGHGAPVTEALCQDKNVRKVVANDISEAQIKLARDRCATWKDKVEFVEGDMMALEFEDSDLDGAAAFFSIFHLPRAEQTQMVEKIYSWLKPGSILVCNFAAGTSNSGKDHAEERTEKWNYFQADMFWSGLGTKGSKKMVEDAGFEVLAADVRNANEDIDRTKELHDSDPDRDVEFLWVVARKPATKP